ncbi:MAG TPA: hypothetical protein DCG38_07780 [Eubacteriaceae bacterium]|nr:hypothetical protein [Eubacteriaceae bacterium]
MNVSSKSRVSSKNLFKRTFYLLEMITGAVLIIGTAYYIDTLAHSGVGVIISWAIALLILLMSLFSYSSAVFVVIFVTAIIPFYARQIYQIYQMGGVWSELYHTPFTVNFLGITLANWLYVLLGMNGIIYLYCRKERLSRDIYIIIITVLLGIPILIIGLLYQDKIYWRQVLSSFQYSILVPLGALVGCRLVKEVGKQRTQKILYKLFWFAFIISGLRAVLFLVSDYIRGSMSLQLGVEEVIFNPFVFACLAERQIIDSRFKLVVFLVLSWLVILPTGRNTWILLIVNSVVLFVLFVCRMKPSTILVRKQVIHRFTSFVVIALLVFIIMGILSPNLCRFILFKLSFFRELFTGNLTSSPLTRIYEFKNISAENYDLGLVGVLFGKGAGGYFTFAHYLPPFELDISAYSSEELSIGIFFNPHDFVNVWLLKGGLIGLGWYIVTILCIFLLSLREARLMINAGVKYNIALWLLFFCPVALLHAVWKPNIAFLFGFMSGVVNTGAKIYEREE